MSDNFGLRLNNIPPRKICEHGSQEVKCPIRENTALEAEIERDAAIAEVAGLRSLAAAAYQGAGAHDWPVPWLDALSAAANGDLFSTDGLLPMETPELLQRAERAESERDELRETIVSLRATVASYKDAIEKAPVATQDPRKSVVDQLQAIGYYDGKRVALVVLDQ